VNKHIIVLVKHDLTKNKYLRKVVPVSFNEYDFRFLWIFILPIANIKITRKFVFEDL